MSWTDVRDAMQAAIVEASGLAADHVLWKYQNQDAPGLPYISMTLITALTRGIDYLRPSFLSTRTPGQEFKLKPKGTREVPWQLEFFTASTADQFDALALGDNTKTRLLVPAVRSLLQAQEISPFDPGPVQYIPDVPNIRFRGRSVCTVRCFVPTQALAEYVSYIASINGVVHVQGGGAGPHDVPFSVTSTKPPFH